ncbi:MAG: BamA/TamA family outer membrane protein [Bacteroidota bacterium]
MAKSFSLFFFCFLTLAGFCQTNALVVDTIFVEGNQRTRSGIIFRELDIKAGSTIPFTDLNPTLARNELYLLNTRLFNDVELNIRDWRGDTINIEIIVQETWYIYPFLIFELADRNFNVWWVEQNRALNRLNLGMRFYYDNFTGRNDRLKAVAQFGYTQKFELEYRLPFFNKGQSLGMAVNGFWSRNREVPYVTNDTTRTLDFFRTDEGYNQYRARAGLKLFYRPKLFGTHEFGIEYLQNRITDTVAVLNPDFFLDGRIRQDYLSFRYRFTLDRRDRQAYPLKGDFFRVQLKKDGLGVFEDVNGLDAQIVYARYFKLNKRFSVEALGKIKKNIITEKQPFYRLQRALGFDENFIRGYEFYVIDGQDYAYLKTGLRFSLFDSQIKANRFMPIKAFKVMPVRLYLKLNYDMGFVNDPLAPADLTLVNDLLAGGGLGLDLIIYHNFVFQFEYSINRLNEKGLYLHFNVPF